jgi:hypothetical protein
MSQDVTRQQDGECGTSAFALVTAQGDSAGGTDAGRLRTKLAATITSAVPRPAPTDQNDRLKMNMARVPWHGRHVQSRLAAVPEKRANPEIIVR